MHILYDLDDSHATQVLSLFRETWWANQRTLEQTEACIKGSQITVGVFDNNKLIGFARAVTDFIYKVIIFDVIVAKHQQEKGIGKELILAIKGHPKLTTIRHFELYCLPEMEAFYEKFGFSTDVDGIKLMRCNNAR